ncbi:hypothetical protein FOC1_g10009616 [Fusarium oxysporum f. sp. cubense race 1]|uniref:Uncharacterized protein n=1 Tax=Fusarium oxysporum f. sp. cubense (strain race 1) TaxID=1229664 RepID=N4UVS3_FUSC1|nr:hypothetical protein FOC1_g10009616 [Fusarium oxysporum f. sp. cubense race 1]
MAKICGIKSILGRWRVRYVRDYAVPEYHPQSRVSMQEPSVVVITGTIQDRERLDSHEFGAGVKHSCENHRKTRVPMVTAHSLFQVKALGEVACLQAGSAAVAVAASLVVPW